MPQDAHAVRPDLIRHTPLSIQPMTTMAPRILAAWLSLMFLALGAVQAAGHTGSDASKILEQLARFTCIAKTNGHTGIAVIHESVGIDPARYEKLVHEGVSRSTPSDQELIEFRKQAHAHLLKGERWRIVRESIDSCIHLVEFADWSTTNVLERPADLHLVTVSNRFDLTSAYDARRRHGWLAAMYQPLISSVLTVEEGSDLEISNLNLGRTLEHDIGLFIMLGLGHTNFPAHSACHPLLYDFSHFKPDPAAIRRSLESGKVSVEPTGTPGLHRIRFHEKDGVDVTVDFAPESSIPVPRVLVGPESRPTRLITREVVRGKPWNLEWKETLWDDAGKQTEFKHRYLLADGPADVPALLNALDDRFRGSKLRSHQDAKGEYVSRMDGRVVSRHRDPRPGSGLTAAHLTIAICVVIAILVTSGLLILRLFRPRP